MNNIPLVKKNVYRFMSPFLQPSTLPFCEVKCFSEAFGPDDRDKSELGLFPSCPSNIYFILSKSGGTMGNIDSVRSVY